MQKAEGKTTSRALTVDDGVIKHLQVWFDVAIPEVENTLRNAENVDDDGHHHRGKEWVDRVIEKEVGEPEADVVVAEEEAIRGTDESADDSVAHPVHAQEDAGQHRQPHQKNARSDVYPRKKAHHPEH